MPQIEHANIVNLDWALAHMDAVRSKKTRQKTGAAEDWVYEAEMKDSIEDVSAILHYAPNMTLTLHWRRILKVLEPYFWTIVRVVSNLQGSDQHTYIFSCLRCSGDTRR